MNRYCVAIVKSGTRGVEVKQFEQDALSESHAVADALTDYLPSTDKHRQLIGQVRQSPYAYRANSLLSACNLKVSVKRMRTDPVLPKIEQVTQLVEKVFGKNTECSLETVGDVQFVRIAVHELDGKAGIARAYERLKQAGDYMPAIEDDDDDEDEEEC